MPPATDWRPRLVALDIDGTLATYGGDIRPRVRTAVQRAIDRGAHVVACSGRTAIGMRPFLDTLGLSAGDAICSNGAVRVDLATGHASVRASFEPGHAIDVLRPLLPDAVYGVEDVGVGNRVTGHFGDYGLLGELTKVDFAGLTGRPVPRMVVWWPGRAPAEMARQLTGVRIDGVHYTIDHVHPWLTAGPAGTTKAAALEHLRVELGVPREDTMAVGDGLNDVEMLSWAAHGVAMGQAPTAVHAVADEVVAGVAGDGAAEALERWFTG